MSVLAERMSLIKPSPTIAATDKAKGKPKEVTRPKLGCRAGSSSSSSSSSVLVRNKNAARTVICTYFVNWVYQYGKSNFMSRCTNSLKSLKIANEKERPLHKQCFQIILPGVDTSVTLWKQSTFQLISRIILTAYTEESKANIISLVKLRKYCSYNLNGIVVCSVKDSSSWTRQTYIHYQFWIHCMDKF
jgi:hypothetical protein